MAELMDEQRGMCRHCGHAVVWYFDRDGEAEILSTEHGWWYDAEAMLESCGGPDGDAHDLWHEV